LPPLDLIRYRTYIVDVDPDGEALDAVDREVILEVLAEDLAGDCVVLDNLQKTYGYYMAFLILLLFIYTCFATEFLA
jgi:hypothetical protein